MAREAAKETGGGQNERKERETEKEAGRQDV
jgi:hypothetical protein